MDYTGLKEKVMTMIKPSRFAHSLGVAWTSHYLARRYGLDESKALCAGIYHDAYRYSSDERAVFELEKAGFVLEEEEKNEPMLLHGALAAMHFDSDAGEKVDDDVKAAVRYHTLGSRMMGPLGAVIYIADYIEPGRKHLSEKDRLNILEKSTLEEMTRLIIEMQKPFLEKNKGGMAAVTEDLYSYITSGGKF